ncbi:MAG: hypothetical protein Tsb0013_15780 [Phycisphaerales bacterium]
MTRLARRIQARRDEQAAFRGLTYAFLIAVAGGIALTLEHGYRDTLLSEWALGTMQITFPWLAMVSARDVRWRELSSKRYTSRTAPVAEVGLALAAFALIFGSEVVPACAAAIAFVVYGIRFQSMLARRLRNAALLFPASFLFLIIASASLLLLPVATPPDQPIEVVDAVFTATSAVCVTGLSVRDTASGFTPFGQAVIFASIQLGGLGVMIFGSTLAMLFGSRLSVREHLTLSNAIEEHPRERLSRYAYFIVLTTLVLEAIGAVVLFASWPPDDTGLGQRAWGSVFHSVSAFCNAGFDITGQSMIGVRSELAPFVGIVPMIVLGGLGFVVLEDVYTMARDRLRRKAQPRRLSTHTRVVLVTTAVLLVGGFVVIFIAQASQSGDVSSQTALDAAFMSVTARTAGFTCVPMEELSPGSRFALLALMTIGGSPGSTAGGMKTVVFAMLVLAVISTVRKRDEVEVFGRALPDAIVKRAATVLFGLFGVIACATFALDLTERIPFEPLLFEVTSAATTTGLSLGATDQLSEAGRLIVALTMYLGRVGALAVLAGLVGGAGEGVHYALPRDSVSLG